ncbi:hypothetical protein [Halorubrum sp. SD683]|uniref:hypothetical protein n=1 Tax=Halorubrum sp. SD683 TaxID=1855873 RepID=UPI000A2E12D8|nr:hypothetical protein [Halorubrum sp. SD683]OTE99114.1 hypothetical protein B9G49_13405 [Halorubrum sp. SD683]
MEDPPNDFLMVISASSKSAVSGTGKTTLGTGCAKTLDGSSSGFDAEEQATLSAGELGYEIIPGVETRSAVVIDESQGTPGGGSALNTRRAMKTETIETIGSILANRDKMLTIIIIVQNFSMLDSWIYPLVDAWLLIRKGPGHPQGPVATHHKVEIDDYDLKNPQLRTPAVEDLSWDPLPEDDPDYQVMDRKKQEAKQKSDGSPDADGELGDQEQLLIAEGYRRTGTAWRKIPEKDERLTYSSEWYRQRISDGESVGAANS